MLLAAPVFEVECIDFSVCVCVYVCVWGVGRGGWEHTKTTILACVCDVSSN